MNLHHALRLRLLAQRVSVRGVISPANSGMALHALRQLSALNVHDGELLTRLDELYPHADIRSQANMFHCLACCVREQQSVHETPSAALSLLLLKMQECMLAEVDDLSPRECILVMEGVVKVTPYRCVNMQLAKFLRSRSTALVDVVSNPIELIGIARIVVEAMQEPSCCSSIDCSGSAEQNEYYNLRLLWSQELCKVSETIVSRIDLFGKQDLLTLVDAVTLRVGLFGQTTFEGHMRRARLSNEVAIRRVPDECRSLVLHSLNRAKHFLTALSPSQVSAWLSRLVYLSLQHNPFFTCLLQRLDEEQIRGAMSLSQLSLCIECISRVICLDNKSECISSADQRLAARVVTKLFDTLVASLERSGGSCSDCSMYLIPTLLSLSERIQKKELEGIQQPLMGRIFRILYNNFGALTSYERANVVTIVFLWGFLKKSFFKQGHRQGDPAQYSENDDVYLLRSWCVAVLTHIGSYNVLDALQIINEVSAAVYVENAAGCDAHDMRIVREMLLRLHELVQGMTEELNTVSSSYLSRYLVSMSKLGIRRKAEYYGVLNILQQRELTDFESLQILGVVARHHLRALSFLSHTVSRIPSWAFSLHVKQKCLLLKYLGQARAHRFVQAPSHSSLELGVFLTPEEILLELPILEAMFAFVGLVQLRQFENKTIGCLLQGPLARHDDLSEIISAAFLSEFIAALCRIDQRLVPSSSLQRALEVAAHRLATSRSFFVDLAELSFWLRLVKERFFLCCTPVEENRYEGSGEEGRADYLAAVEKYVSVAAAIAKTRLQDIARSKELRPNTFLFGQMATGYRLGVVLPRTTEERLAQHLDTKHLAQLLNNPRQVISAVTTARHICHINQTVSAEVFEFTVKVFGSLGVQEVLLLGVEMADALRHAGDMDGHALVVMRKLHGLARQNLSDAQRWKKLSVQERALGIRYGIADDYKCSLST